MANALNEYDFSIPARADLKGILRYTRITLGKEKENEYAAQFDNAIKVIIENPKIGKALTGVTTSHRSYKVQSHIIIYKIKKTSVFISRILHSKMEVQGKKLH
jgi:plasmid stabilization system protein ParE